jgi:hypothetical protein
VRAPGRDHRPVGGSEIEGIEFSDGHPAERDVFVRVGLRATRSKVTDERDHLDGNGIRVGEARQGTADDEFAPEFLADFADDGGLGGFAGLDLAAGKFPPQRQVFVCGALGHEYKAIALDHGTDHGNGRWGSHGGKRMDTIRGASSAIHVDPTAGIAATFSAQPGSGGMNTFLKILLLLVLAVVAVKIEPILLLPISLQVAGLLTLWATVSVAAVALFSLLLVLAVGLSGRPDVSHPR